MMLRTNVKGPFAPRRPQLEGPRVLPEPPGLLGAGADGMDSVGQKHELCAARHSAEMGTADLQARAQCLRHRPVPSRTPL